MVDHVEITKEKIEVDKVTDLVSSPVCGATSVFIGQGDNFNYFLLLFFNPCPADLGYALPLQTV